MLDVRLRYEGRSDDLDPRRMSLIPRKLDQLKRHNSWMTFSGASAYFPRGTSSRRRQEYGRR